jgi:hypothetical protein
MIFTLSSITDLHQFQAQTLCLKLPQLEDGVWKSHISSRIFETVHVSILKPSEKTATHTTILRSSQFIAGSSCLNAIDSLKGGTVRFPLNDVLNLWIRSLHLPEKQDSQMFLERIFALGFGIRVVLQFAKIATLYLSYMPIKLLPVVEHWIDSDSLSSVILARDSCE